ncbi:MAG: relaxase/mobilization nuclease domain-containing protein [Lachnospiraceae bacterium]|nr:relaxase/mobilization nuclease domain-containing protein [Lachnospiraceae bacterium]
MAVSKIWPIYQTLDKAIKYICNYEKTADGTLIDTYECSEKFADYEFQDIAAKARKVKNSRIAYHAIISFSPEDDLTPEKALEAGRQIIEQYTGKKYQYVLCTHTDQKHIHVHCIFNSVNFSDYKKLQIKDKDLDRLEKITDKICRENNLSVIEEKSGVKGRGKYEYNKHQENLSWKDKLRDAIDRNILLSESYEDFIERMQMEEGYQIKQGKYLSFTLDHEGQKRSTRNRSLGDFYSIESIKDRIEHKEKYIQINTPSVPEEGVPISNSEKPEQNLEEPKESSILAKEGISLEHKMGRLIDVWKNSKAQTHTAYRKKLNMININTYAGMINFVKKYHLVYAEDFEKILQELEAKNTSITNEIHKAYKELNQLESDVRQIRKFLDNRLAHEQYAASTDPDERYRLSEANKKYESALYYFKKNNLPPKDAAGKNLKHQMRRIEELKRNIEKLKGEGREVGKDMRQLSIIKENNEKVLGSSFAGSPELAQDAEHKQKKSDIEK